MQFTHHNLRYSNRTVNSQSLESLPKNLVRVQNHCPSELKEMAYREGL